MSNMDNVPNHPILTNDTYTPLTYCYIVERKEDEGGMFQSIKSKKKDDEHVRI